MSIRSIYERVNQNYVSIQDLGPEYTLVSNSQDIHQTLKDIAYPGDLDDYGCLLVKLGDGEYLSVWGVQNYIPYLCSRVHLLWVEGTLVTH